MKTLLKIACGLAFASSSMAQTPASSPIVVQAANAAAATPALPASPSQDSTSVQAAVKSLEEVKAANGETLKKQEAVLQQLEEMQKAADQLKIFAHRTGG